MAFKFLLPFTCTCSHYWCYYFLVYLNCWPGYLKIFLTFLFYFYVDTVHWITFYTGGGQLRMLILIWFGSMKGHWFKATCISIGSSRLLFFAWRGVRAKEDSIKFGNQLWHINYCWNEDTSAEYKTQKKIEWDWRRNKVVLCKWGPDDTYWHNCVLQSLQ